MSNVSIADQIIEFVKRYKDRINKEDFSVVEFVIQKAKLDGMRIKEYIKNRDKK